MPVKLETLKIINKWTNTFVHSGIVPFCWQSMEAIDLIEKLFSTKHEETGEINMEGFSYLDKGISLSDLKEALDSKFSAIFYLSEDFIEGSRY